MDRPRFTVRFDHGTQISREVRKGDGGRCLLPASSGATAEDPTAHWWGFTIEGENVNAMKMLGIVLIVGGVLALVYGGFTYTKESHEAKIGPLVLSVTDKETVNVPIWVGVGAVVIGGLILVFGSKKS